MNTLNQSQTSSISLSTAKYSLSRVDSAYTINNQIKVPSFLLASVLTAASITYPVPPIHTDSSVFYKRDLNYFSNTRSTKDFIVAFSTELYKKSRSITEEESLLVRKMILAKAKTDIPIF